jgi:anti-sigma regulatory factor (Ser/Thr protein kinase)
VNFPRRWPRASQALLYLALPALFSLAGTVEALLRSDGTGWPEALWREFVYGSAWVVLIPPIFRLCQWMHDGSRRWPRYAFGLTAGTVLTILLFPFSYEIIRLGLWWFAWKFTWVAQHPLAFWPEYHGLFLHFLTASVVTFACTVIAWYAVTNYREARERKLEAVELGAMLQLAQLQALRSQLNPHFLFNTLHSIAELIHENPRHAEQMVLQLGELLHKALKTQAVQVPLSEELDFIRSYLAIEQMRLGERLELAWKIDPAAVDVLVPSLILQPIVENSIQHGIAVSSHPGRLEISAGRTNGQLRLEVRDNGPGLGAPPGKPGNGIGLENTRARLQRLYGSRAALELTNDRGLVVSMTLPVSDSTA